jgi:hypothetical protein
MLPVLIDIVIGIASLVFLKQMSAIGGRLQSHSVLFRLLLALFSYGLFFGVFDYLLNFFLLMNAMILEGDFKAGIGWVGMVLTTTLLYRIYLFYDEKIELREMLNIAMVAIRFGNYFRLRDADTRELIGTHRMKRIYEEVHGAPFKEEVLATPFDQMPTTFKKVPVEALKDTRRKLPLEFREEAALLEQGKRADVSASFRLELMGNRSHPFFALMDSFIIDPKDGSLTIEIRFPSERMVPVERAADRDRLVGHIYVAVHVLMELPWFRLYEPYVKNIVIIGVQRYFNDAMVETARPIVRFAAVRTELRGRGTRITTAADMKNIASIQFFSH